MPTGVRTFDEATRGGPLSGRLGVFGGAPGAGKTSFVMQLARHFFLAGHAVAFVAADEEADGLAIRWGQQEGLSRDALEHGDAAARTALADAVRADRLLLVDQDEEDATLEDAINSLRPLALATGRPGVLVVDSLQTVNTAARGDFESARARVDCTMSVLKRAAKVDGFLVLATSELARSAYRGGRDSPTSGLASFKESGSIEYGAGFALTMVNAPGEAFLIDVAFEKNRLGQKLQFRLVMDPGRATLNEVEALPVPDAETVAALKDNERTERLEKAAAKLMAALASSSVPICNQQALRALAIGSSTFRALTVNWLIARGKICGGKGAPFAVVAAVSE